MKPLPEPTADTPSLPEIRQALDLLTPLSERCFGTMTPAQMLRHNRRFMELYLGEVRVGKGIRFVAGLVGPFFLKKVLSKSAMDTPKNLKTLPVLRAKEGEELDFEAEKAEFTSLLTQVEGLTGELDHALYGSMDSRTAQNLVRHHTAHHFHQFGLLDPR